MTVMIEKLFKKSKGRESSEETSYSPYVYMEGFDPGALREMEDFYIELGYMTDEERMPIPPDIEARDPRDSSDRSRTRKVGGRALIDDGQATTSPDLH